jgi:hypothetical protein
MSLVFIILCWFSLGITALYWLRFETITMWICRPHYWWETEAAAISMTLCVAVFTLCASACYVKQMVNRRRVCADKEMEFEEPVGSKVESN